MTNVALIFVPVECGVLPSITQFQRLGVIFSLVMVGNLVCMLSPLSPLNKGQKSTLRKNTRQ